MSTVLSSAAELLAAAGTKLGATDWLEITQERVNLFADATAPHQWDLPDSGARRRPRRLRRPRLSDPGPWSISSCPS